jgi:hypothetical protein
MEPEGCRLRDNRRRHRGSGVHGHVLAVGVGGTTLRNLGSEVYLIRTSRGPGFFYRPKVVDISEIFFLSPESDKI